MRLSLRPPLLEQRAELGERARLLLDERAACGGHLRRIESAQLPAPLPWDFRSSRVG